TGCYPGATGFYGNTVYEPGAGDCVNSEGRPVVFSQPVFTEDYKILRALDALHSGRLLLPGTLFDAARAAGLTTAAVGKSGPAFLQDRERGGVVVDEKHVWPLEDARRLQAAGYALPRCAPLAFPEGALTLADGNGDPTRGAERRTLTDGVTTDPTDAGGSPYD